MLYGGDENSVLIEGKSIPATNIELVGEGWVSFGGDDDAKWFGPSFEIDWPDGAKWIVEETKDDQGFDQIIVSEWNPKAFGQRVDDPVFERPVDNWVKFLEMYEAKLNRR